MDFCAILSVRFDEIPFYVRAFFCDGVFDDLWREAMDEILLCRHHLLVLLICRSILPFRYIEMKCFFKHTRVRFFGAC